MAASSVETRICTFETPAPNVARLYFRIYASRIPRDKRSIMSPEVLRTICPTYVTASSGRAAHRKCLDWSWVTPSQHHPRQTCVCLRKGIQRLWWPRTTGLTDSCDFSLIRIDLLQAIAPVRGIGRRSKTLTDSTGAHGIFNLTRWRTTSSEGVFRNS